MSNQPPQIDEHTRNAVALTRLEEGLKHLGQTVVEGFKDIKDSMAKRDTRDDLKHTELEARLTVVEKQVPLMATKVEVEADRLKLAKVYWAWGALTFIGGIAGFFIHLVFK